MSLYQVTAFSLSSHSAQVRNLCLLSEEGFLRYEEHVVYNTTAKFGYEDAKNGLGVHFRCLHNNKYLVRKTGTDWITATAEKPVEEVSSQECTLFRVEMVDATTMRWVHLASETTVSIVDPDDIANSYYLSVASSGNDDHHVVCTPIDVERIIKLPKTVTFKSDEDTYLEVGGDDNESLAFIGEDGDRKEAWYDIVPLSNGDVRIMSVKTKKFWRRHDDGEIKADYTATSTNSNTFFQVARLRANAIGLINRGETETPFIRRSTSGTTNLLTAKAESGVKEARFVVEEPVVSRTIEVEYRLDDARIYDVEPRSWLSQVAHNDSTEGNLQTTLSIAYSEALSCSFKKTTTVVTDVNWTTTFTAKIPFVADVNSVVKLSAGKTVVTSFEETIDKSETMEFTATVLVPPGQRRRARIMANEAKCDVPFSYVQTEVRADNTVVRTVLHDGIYQGMNGYEFHVQVYDPVEPDNPKTDEPVATRMLPDPLGRDKIYRLMKN